MSITTRYAQPVPTLPDVVAATPGKPGKTGVKGDKGLQGEPGTSGGGGGVLPIITMTAEASTEFVEFDLSEGLAQCRLYLKDGAFPEVDFVGPPDDGATWRLIIFQPFTGFGEVSWADHIHWGTDEAGDPVGPEIPVVNNKACIFEFVRVHVTLGEPPVIFMGWRVAKGIPIWDSEPGGGGEG